ncbi:methionyl-tRNA formyltransferase [Paenalkalicoccus suaedae]|uniref:Methionyl-tRNA formyltransferase n=1 Tax=Paenalkalicoccus suaedae TaxID=2592382 RepID=A0A859FGZ7_9BACI|nr:methionyl-tRNA formyltransferase [Paenalkalicoccus suaedae]QKS71485.1 methionyl-tRNA formyltransferase [Paenalkalicoccus suaedae]
MMNIVFMGTPDFAVPVLQTIIDEGHTVSLVVTQPDRPKGRKRELTPPPVKVAALELGLPVFQPEKIRHDYQAVQEAAPDLIVTAAFGQLLPTEVLEIPAKGCINVHASLLPKYRGGAPIHQSIIDGEAETGVTIMYMVEKLDAGDMLLKRAIPITDEDNTGTMHDKLSKLGAQMIKEMLPKMEASVVEAEKQDEAAATFAPNIKKEQEVIDWTQDARSVFNHIRGLAPWPVAYTTLGETRLKLWSSVVAEGTTTEAPGTIVKLESDLLHVACGDETVLALKEVQPAGKKPMNVETFLRGAGAKLALGDKLGDL